MGLSNVYEFLSGPVLIFAAVLLGLRWIGQLILYARSLAVGSESRNGATALSLPLGKAAATHPASVVLAYLLHVGLLVLPFGVAEHTFSFFMLPTEAVGPISLVVIFLVLLSVIRAAPSYQGNASRFIIAFFAVITLVSGCGLLYSPDSWEHLALLHIVSALLLIFSAVFMTTLNRFNRQRCTGCAACYQNCPTKAIDTKETGGERIFSFEARSCIRCARCMAVCPENAIRLLHDLGMPWQAIWSPGRETIRVEMARCESCGALMAPVPQIEKVDNAIHLSAIRSLCPTCRENALMPKE